MKNKKALDNLKTNLEPYLVLWEDWIKDERCNLDKEEIHILKIYLKNNFEFSLFERLFKNKTRVITKINSSLINNYPLYKDWIISKFLCKIIALGKSSGQNNFMSVPVEELNIRGEIKTNLKSFKINSIQDFPHQYTDEGLGSENTFKKILAFHGLCRMEERLKS